MTLDHAPAPTGTISRSTAMAVRRALHALRDGWLLEGRLRAAARMVAEDARRHGLRAEQMLVALKREWGGLVRTRAADAIREAGEFAERLITLCIHEFYAPSRGADVPCPVLACRAG
jgi:hypothetical protein